MLRLRSKQILILTFLVSFCGFNSALSVNKAKNLVKRSAAPSNDDNLEQWDSNSNKMMNINYDEYPMVVPKRAAILLDRIMVALHHALEDGDQEGVRRINDLYKDSRHGAGKTGQLGKDTIAKFIPNFNSNEDMQSDDISVDLDERNAQNLQNSLADDDDMTGLQRRGHSSGEGLGSNKGRVYWRCYFNAVTCF